MLYSTYTLYVYIVLPLFKSLKCVWDSCWIWNEENASFGVEGYRLLVYGVALKYHFVELHLDRPFSPLSAVHSLFLFKNNKYQQLLPGVLNRQTLLSVLEHQVDPG